MVKEVESFVVLQNLGKNFANTYHHEKKYKDVVRMNRNLNAEDLNRHVDKDTYVYCTRVASDPKFRFKVLND